MGVTFDGSPEKEASILQFLYRQLFVTPPAVSSADINLHGKTAIITGSNTGIGLECARQLLDLGLSNLILAVRDETKGELARLSLDPHGDPKLRDIQVWNLNLSDYGSIVQFAQKTKGLDHLDIVILNAGVHKATDTFNPLTHYEESVQVNFLSTMQLAILLVPVMKSKKTASQPGRMTLVSSDAVYWTKFKERGEHPLLPIFKQKAE